MNDRNRPEELVHVDLGSANRFHTNTGRKLYAIVRQRFASSGYVVCFTVLLACVRCVLVGRGKNVVSKQAIDLIDSAVAIDVAVCD
jgi:hypothetical protein